MESCSDATTMRKTGAAQTNDTTIAARWIDAVAACLRIRARRYRVLERVSERAIGNALLSAAADEDRGDDGGDEEQHQAHRGRVRDAATVEGVLVDVPHRRVGGRARTALRHDEDQVEQLHRV